VRAVIKFFRGSALKNDLLQKYAVDAQGQELESILYSKTPWNSLFDMLQRYCVRHGIITTVSQGFQKINRNKK
jgi:hypothetical protein